MSKDKEFKSGVPPTKGRIVMFVPGDSVEQIDTYGSDTDLPAMVVKVGENDRVNLKVHTDAEQDQWEQSVPYNPEKAPYSWHWPEVKR